MAPVDQILGLSAGADREEVIAAWLRRLDEERDVVRRAAVTRAFFAALRGGWEEVVPFPDEEEVEAEAAREREGRVVPTLFAAASILCPVLVLHTGSPLLVLLSIPITILLVLLAAFTWE